MSAFDWIDDGEQITPEFLVRQGFIPITSYTTRKITWYSFDVEHHHCRYGISVNLETNTVSFRTNHDMKWTTIQLGDTQQIILLKSQLKTIK